MTTQIMQAPAASRSLAPAVGIARYLWMRFHRNFLIIALLCLISTVVDRLFFPGSAGVPKDERHLSHFLLLLLPPVALILSPLVAAETIDERLWILPLRTRTLVGWLVFYGCVYIALFWTVCVVCIWRPAGWNIPILWPAAELAAGLTAMFAVSRHPLMRTMAPGSLPAFTLFVLMVCGALSLHADSAMLSAGCLAAIPVITVLAVTEAARARRGEAFTKRRQRKIRSSFPLREAFRSPMDAQLWRELGSIQWTEVKLFVGFGLLSLAMLFMPVVTEVGAITFLTQGAHPVNAKLWADLSPILLGLALALFALGDGMSLGLGTDNSQPWNSEASTPFFAAYPVDAAVKVAAKLRAAAVTTAVTLCAVLPFIAIWMIIPATEAGAPVSLGAAFWTALGAHAALKIAAAMLLAAIALWKIQTEALCVTLTGRRWLVTTVALSILGLLAIPPLRAALSDAAKYAMDHQGGPLITAILATMILTKFSMCALLAVVLRRRGLASSQTLRGAVITWAAVAAALFALTCAAFVPAQLSWQSAALAVVCFMPGVRIALAPLALAWGRSR